MATRVSDACSAECRIMRRERMPRLRGGRNKRKAGCSSTSPCPVVLIDSAPVHVCVCMCVCAYVCVCVCFSTRTARQDTLVLWAAPARSVQQVSRGPYQRHHVHESRMLMITLLCRRDVHVSLGCDCLYCVPCGNGLSSRCVALFSAICFSHSPAQARARAIEKGRGGQWH